MMASITTACKCALLAAILQGAAANFALGDLEPVCQKPDGTDFKCPPGLSLTWVDGHSVPPVTYVGVPVLLRVSLNLTEAVFESFGQHGLLPSSMTAAEQWQQCAVPNTPCADSTDVQTCCIIHTNMHPCENLPGKVCGEGHDDHDHHDHGSHGDHGDDHGDDHDDHDDHGDDHDDHGHHEGHDDGEDHHHNETHGHDDHHNETHGHDNETHGHHDNDTHGHEGEDHHDNETDGHDGEDHHEDDHSDHHDDHHGHGDHHDDGPSGMEALHDNLMAPKLAQSGYAGVDGHSTWDFKLKLYWEGSYTIIVDFHLAHVYIAVGIPTEVRYAASACPEPLVPSSRSGLCERCPSGTQPLSAGIPPGGARLSDEEALSTGRNQFCIVCPAGMVSDDGVHCLDCPAGQFQESAGRATCELCVPGTFAYVAGATVCQACLGGTFAAAGSTQCSSCPRGRFRPQYTANHSDDVGDADDCTLCPAPAGFVPYTTLERASDSAAECVCPEGSYEVLGKGCQACTDGMHCPNGNLSAPLQQVGFYVMPASDDGEYEAHRCFPTHCFAAEAGTCADGREGFACGRCKEWHYPQRSGLCAPCATGDIVPAVASAVLVVVFVVAVSLYAGVDAARQRLAAVGLVCILGQVVVTMQLVSSLDTIPFRPVEPLATGMVIIRFISLNLDILKLQCVFGSDNSLMKYAMMLFSYPMVAFLMLIALFVVSCLPRARLNRFDIANSLGLLMLIIFLPITTACLRPFRCVVSPSGDYSVYAAPNVLCGSPEHATMLGLGVIGTLVYPIFFLVLTVGVTWFYPRFVALGRGSDLLRCCRFLFQRFSPNRYYYSLVYMARSTLAALLPVAFPEPGYYLPFCLTSTIVAVALVQSMLWPWRTYFANLNDLATGFFLVMVLAVTNALVTLPQATLDTQVSVIVSTCVIVCVLLGVLLAVLTAWRAMGRGGKRFCVFLTHHKAGAGGLARFLKLRMQQRVRSEVFLDVDNLDNLEDLFDTVRSDTSTLFALLTEETLRRPWCAGELVMAVKNGIPVTIALREDLELPTPEALDAICDLWSPEDMHPLSAAGICTADVRACYQQLRGFTQVRLPKTFGTCDDLKLFEESIDSFLHSLPMHEVVNQSECKQVRSVRSIVRSGSSVSLAEDSLYVIANMAEAEAAVAAYVFADLATEQTHKQPTILYSPEEVENANNGHVCIVIMLHKGCLESPLFVQLLVAAQRRWGGCAAIVPVVADKDFSFPAKEDVARRLVPAMSVAADVEEEVIAECYAALLSVLALVLSVQHSSRDILNAEVDMILRRVQRAQVSRRNSGDLVKPPANPTMCLLCSATEELQGHHRAYMASKAPISFLRAGELGDEGEEEETEVEGIVGPQLLGPQVDLKGNGLDEPEMLDCLSI